MQRMTPNLVDYLVETMETTVDYVSRTNDKGELEPRLKSLLPLTSMNPEEH